MDLAPDTLQWYQNHQLYKYNFGTEVFTRSAQMQKHVHR